MTVKTQRTIAIAIALLIFMIGGILTKTYRQYIYRNDIFDYHLADAIGSLACIPCSSLFWWAIYKGYFSFVRCILYSLIAFILFEILPVGVFDYYDIIAMFISSGLTWLIYLTYKRYFS
jgi:hypothetical protein